MTKQEAAGLVAMAAASYPGMQEKNLAPVAQVWMELLSDMPLDLAKKAVLKHITTSKFFPTIAELRQHAKDLTRPAIPLSPEEAWDEVMTKIRNQTKGYSSLTVKRAVEAVGGLNAIGYTDMAELGFVRAHFMRTYEAFTRRAEIDEEMGTFENLLERIEQKRLEREKPKEIGG